MHDARLYSYYSYCMYDWFVLGEVFGCVLSLYMSGKDQPLPTDEEVIVCDENTTAEEVSYNVMHVMLCYVMLFSSLPWGFSVADYIKYMTLTFNLN